MFGFRRGRVHVLAAGAFMLGSVLLLSCQPAQPVATPKPAEKAAEKPAEKGTTATATKPAEKPVRGGTLRMWTSGDPAAIDPIVTTTGGIANLFESLIESDVDGNLTKEGLARDWSIGSDGKSVTFKLRGGVKFHDGTDFDAAAVKFIIDRIKDPATKSPTRSDFDSVNSVEVVDSLTVRLNLKQPDPLLLSTIATMKNMVSPAAVKKYGQDFGRNPVGTGPFQFVEWVADDHITLKRFEGYWGKDKDGNQLPYLDRLVLMSTPKDIVGAANLRAGTIDLMGARGFPPEQLPILKNDPNLAYTIRPFTDIGVTMNTQKPPFDNKALRQAVALSMDRAGMAAAWGEAGSAAASPLNAYFNWGYDAKTGVYPALDLAKAKAKLAEAGYPSGLKVKFLVPSNHDLFMKLAQMVQGNLAEIGIHAQFEAVAQVVWLTRVMQGAGDYEIATGFTAPKMADPGYILGTYHSQSSRNFMGPYSNPRVDELLNKAGNIYDQKERTALYQEAVKIIVDDAPFFQLISLNAIRATSKKVRNYVPYVWGGDQVREVWLAP